MPLETWFPTVVFYEDIPLDPAVRQGALEAVHERADPQAILKNGYVTANNAVNDLHLDPRLPPVFDALRPRLHHFLFDLMQFDPGRVEFYLGRCWPVVQVDNGYAGTLHYHSGAAFSAVYYLQVPEGAGALEFFKPIECAYDCIPKASLSALTYRTAIYPALESRLIVFSADLRHRRTANTPPPADAPGANAERIAIAFDLYTAGDIQVYNAGMPRLEFLRKLF